MSKFAEIKQKLVQKSSRWLVTGVAGFIGSHLLEELLLSGQEVVGLDNFSTGKQENLDLVKEKLGNKVWEKFHFIYGDICSPEACKKACKGVDYILHQAALGSVPRSIVNPWDTTKVNVNGFNEVVLAAKEVGVKRIVYASSSSVYGNQEVAFRQEENCGQVLSPYAASKRTNEIYAEAFSAAYGLELIGLRYFNVFGPRQNPEGEYAAVIPKWIKLLKEGKQCTIFGDGLTSRDFCYVKNVVQANILAIFAEKNFCNQVYNVAVGKSTTLNELFFILADEISKTHQVNNTAIYQNFRLGDVKSSLADITKVSQALGYFPEVGIKEGLAVTVAEYAKPS